MFGKSHFNIRLVDVNFPALSGLPCCLLNFIGVMCRLYLVHWMKRLRSNFSRHIPLDMYNPPEHPLCIFTQQFNVTVIEHAIIADSNNIPRAATRLARKINHNNRTKWCGHAMQRWICLRSLLRHCSNFVRIYAPALPRQFHFQSSPTCGWRSCREPLLTVTAFWSTQINLCDRCCFLSNSGHSQSIVTAQCEREWGSEGIVCKPIF